MCVFVCGRVENLFLLFTLLSFFLNEHKKKDEKHKQQRWMVATKVN